MSVNNNIFRSSLLEAEGPDMIQCYIELYKSYCAYNRFILPKTIIEINSNVNLFIKELHCKTDMKVSDSDIHYKINKILHYVKDKTRTFDITHNYVHAYIVCNNALKIAKKINIVNNYIEFLILFIISVCHDLYDSKYITEQQILIEQQKLTTFLKNEIFFKTKNSTKIIQCILLLIDNISFHVSDVNTQQNKMYSKFINILKCARDADRLETFGTLGFLRAIFFGIIEWNDNEKNIKYNRNIVNSIEYAISRANNTIINHNEMIGTKIGNIMFKFIYPYMEYDKLYLEFLLGIKKMKKKYIQNCIFNSLTIDRKLLDKKFCSLIYDE